MSHEGNTRYVFESQIYLCAKLVRVSLRFFDQLNAKDADKMISIVHSFACQQSAKIFYYFQFILRYEATLRLFLIEASLSELSYTAHSNWPDQFQYV